MSYFPLNPIEGTYSSKSIGFEVGKERDHYSIMTSYYHNVETDEITHHSYVVKNQTYSELGKGKEPIEGKKYRETLTQGTLKQCADFIDNIIKAKGYWRQDPNSSFEKIFIEPMV